MLKVLPPESVFQAYGLINKGLRPVLVPLVDEANDEENDEENDEIVEDIDAISWKTRARRKQDAVEKVNRILAAANLTMDAVIGYTLSKNIDFIERIERLIAVAETRRNAMLREIDRHRESLARPLRRTIEPIEEGDISRQNEIGRRKRA